jgi:hypothetical protein
LNPLHQRDDRLAEQDQREQTEALGKMIGVWWERTGMSMAATRDTDLHGHRNAPDDEPRRDWRQRREEPDRRRNHQPESRFACHSPGLCQPSGAQVLGTEHQPHHGVGRGEPGGGIAGETVLRVGGHEDHGHHLQECQRPLHAVVRVEARNVHREAVPGPPDGQQEKGIAQQAVERVVGGQRRADLGNRGHEDQVEEELEPGHPSGAGGIQLGPEPERTTMASVPNRRFGAQVARRGARLARRDD